MRHVFLATKLGWEREQEIVWFEADDCSVEEAEAEFVPYEGVTQDGYPYVGYEFDGQQYYSFQYLGDFEADNMPG